MEGAVFGALTRERARKAPRTTPDATTMYVDRTRCGDADKRERSAISALVRPVWVRLQSVVFTPPRKASTSMSTTSTPPAAANYTFRTCVENSERVAWRLDDVFARDAVLDFTRPFLPEALLPTARLEFLEPHERRKLNQIGAKAYMNLFGFVEVYIEAMAIEHAQAALFGDRDEMRALTRFTDEEVKHQELFARYCAAFDRDFGSPCEVLANAYDVAQIILAKSPLCVLLVTLHIEQMTQQHYVEAVKDSTEIDPLNAEILRNHWLEESQHARIDALLLQRLAVAASSETRTTAHEEYLGVLEAFDGLLGAQAAMDVASLERVLGRALTTEQRAAAIANQHSGHRKTFIHYGMVNPLVLETIHRFWPDRESLHRARAEATAR